MSYTKDQLVSIKVYDANAKCLGTVKDVAFTVGQETLSLLVAKDKQTDITLGWKDVQAIGDIIILKGPEIKQSVQVQQVPACPSCGQPLTWIAKYGRWYCYKEQKYA